jgi:hypothetical protein
MPAIAEIHLDTHGDDVGDALEPADHEVGFDIAEGGF